jgi:hypothetical protein
MKMTRLVIVTLATVAAVAIGATPAHAIPAGKGWSGSWEYTGGTSIAVAVEVPGAKIVANGWDALGVRAFVVTLTDTAAADGKCAYVSWSTASGLTEKWACSNSVQFLPPSADSSILVTVCRDTAAGGAPTNCNPLDVPSSKSDSFIRTPGNAFSWYYYTDVNDKRIEDWAAHLTLGAVNFNYYGVDDAPAGKRWILPYLSTFNSTYVCGSGRVLFGSVPSSLSLCGPNQIQSMPQTTVVGTAWGEGCVWSMRGILDKHCVFVRVPEPS